MNEASGSAERSRDFERLLTFIDAIVAIAVTLLVLPLVDIVGELDHDESVAHLLRQNLAPIGAFFLSFIVIADLWVIQHRVMRNVITSKPSSTAVLLFWSLTIVVLPFPTALLAGPHGAAEQTITKVLYVGTIAVSSVALSLFTLMVARDRSLRDSDDSPDLLRSFAASAMMLIVLAVMLLVPSTSYWPLLLTAATDTIVNLVRRHSPVRTQLADTP